MAFPDPLALSRPARFSLAGGFFVAVAIASILKAPADPFAQLGPFGMFGVDKWVHVGSYALATLLLAYAALDSRLWVLALIGVVSVLFGAGVELVQSTIPWRTMEFADVVANTVGTTAALAVWRASWSRLSMKPVTWARG